MESIISGCGKFNRRKDKDLIEARSALVQAWIDDVERAFEKVDKNLPDMMARHIADICYRESERLKKQTSMERKIGEIFEYKGEWYQCVEQSGCGACSFRKNDTICHSLGCSELVVRDSTPVIFKKLEKVGEPYMTGNKLIQRYKIYPTTCCINVYGWYYQNLDVKSWTIDIELKQTKEDMEEKKPNLKPFDIQKAREGKPVCTRDGRKARIICFDVKGDICPIIALVEENGMEVTKSYDMNGRANYKNADNYDLMMLPEKKGGWINVYNSLGVITFSHNPYDTKEEALEALKSASGKKYYVDTIKIYWEE